MCGIRWSVFIDCFEVFDDDNDGSDEIKPKEMVAQRKMTRATAMQQST